MARLEGVLFDLGDTLVDLGEGRGSYEQRLVARVGRVYDVLTARGLALGDRAAFCKDLAGDSEARYHAALDRQAGISVFEVMRQFLEERGWPAGADIVDAAGEAYCTGGAAVPSGLRVGAIETLSELSALGIRLGVISNTIQPARFMRPTLERRGLAPFMSVQLYSSDCGVAKPHAAIFRQALSELGVPAENCAYVGDRLYHDVGGAQRVGMQGVLIRVGHRHETHAAIIADATVDELPELIGVLPRLFSSAREE